MTYKKGNEKWDSNVLCERRSRSIEIFKKKYHLDIELKTIGKYSVKHPVETIGQLIDMQLLIIEHENKILELEK